ncbi:hypothetical protein K8R66_01265 [bacterium]|nr:hypothetical protein [bacterium]
MTSEGTLKIFQKDGLEHFISRISVFDIQDDKVQESIINQINFKNQLD